jgi:hypothetical protein
MKNLRDLDVPHQFAALEAATGVEKGRFQVWVKTGQIEFLEADHPGHGRRRSYRLIDIYQCRLIVALVRQKLPISDAIEIVNRALYPASVKRQMKSGELARLYSRDLSYLPDEYKYRDTTAPRFLVAHRSPSIGWLVKPLPREVRLGDIVKDRYVQMPDGDPHPTSFVVLNITAELAAVDDVLRARRHHAGEN